MSQPRGIKRIGGRAPKWDRLHEQEMREAKAIVERICGRELQSLELMPLWEVLSRWASHRYKVCYNNAWQAEKKRRGGIAVGAGTLLPPAPVASAVVAKSEDDDGEKLPWE